MDPALYNAALEGITGIITQMGPNQLHTQLTPNRNTVLHIAAQFEKNTQCVGTILGLCPKLLLCGNVKGETALHVAARRGNYDIITTLINSAKASENDIETAIRVARELVRRNTIELNTALHEAVRYNHVKVVELLITEDPEFVYSANSDGESPLYMAVARGFLDVAMVILQKYESPVYDGPCGRTVLHVAAVLKSYKEEGKQLTSKLLLKAPHLLKKADQDGWTPLHWVAYYNFWWKVKQFLDIDKSVAYLQNNQGMTALHVAASRDSKLSMIELVKCCPDFHEIVDNNGRNILHIAAENGHKTTVKYILKNSQFNNFINERDNDGNTPLHLLANSRRHISALTKHPDLDKRIVNKKQLTALDVIESDTLFSTSEEDYTRIDLQDILLFPEDVWSKTNVIANKNENEKGKTLDEKEKGKTLDENEKGKTLDENEKGKRLDRKAQYIQSASESHLIVATLIATVTFAAGFTIPGGYISDEGPDQGMAILTKKAAFQAFIISNSISLTISISAVTTHFFVSLQNDERKRHGLFLTAVYLTMLALAAMMVAFMTGTYVVLAHSWLAIFTCVICCIFFIYYGYSFCIA